MVEFTGRIAGGRFVLDRRDAFSTLKQSLEGKRFVMRLEPEPDFPDASRKYYFGVIVKALAEHSGHTVVEAHKGLKERFLTWMDSNGRPYVPSLALIHEYDRWEYYDRCSAYLGELGIIIETPPDYQMGSERRVEDCGAPNVMDMSPCPT